MAKVAYQKLENHGGGLWALLGLYLAVILVGLGAALYMEHHGHIVTGMTNSVVWGMPHVFAVFLIVAASGALNVASFSSVFGRVEYKPYARLSGILAIALLAGGLAVLVLDLGRPERLVVAMTKYNFRSIFAWNIYLYTGFMVVVGAYLFVMMDRRVGRIYWPTKAVGSVAFAWRLILTTGTGSIFGFLLAREAYSAAIMAPLFIAASFLYGLSFMILVLMTSGADTREDMLGEDMTKRFGGLLILFSLATLYFTAVHHVTKIYATEYRDVEAFLLLNGGIYTVAFWAGQIVVGALLPLAILVFVGRGRGCVTAASVLFLLGGVAHMYVTIIGAQAYPLNLFPGMDVTSSFGDGSVAAYSPSTPEVLLGVSGIAIALLLVGIAVKVMPFLPRPARA